MAAPSGPVTVPAATATPDETGPPAADAVIGRATKTRAAPVAHMPRNMSPPGVWEAGRQPDHSLDSGKVQDSDFTANRDSSMGSGSDVDERSPPARRCSVGVALAAER